LFHYQHIRRFEIAVNHAFLVCVLNRATHRQKKFQSLADSDPIAVAVLRYGYAFYVLHYEVRPALRRGARVEDPCDIRVVHHRQRLTLIGEAGEHLAGVHAEFYNFEGHSAANGFALLSQVHCAHATLA
jgi:hypothetical protein